MALAHRDASAEQRRGEMKAGDGDGDAGTKSSQRGPPGSRTDALRGATPGSLSLAAGGPRGAPRRSFDRARVPSVGGWSVLAGVAGRVDRGSRSNRGDEFAGPHHVEDVAPQLAVGAVEREQVPLAA